jgi:O-antigen/teichoic acid export membrane protein
MGTAVEPSSGRIAATREIGTAVKHGFAYGIGGILTKIAGFLLLPFYTHYLTPKSYGVLEILDLSMSLLGMFLSIGITSAMLRFYGAAKSLDEQRRVVGSIYTFAIGTGAVVFLIGLVCVRPVTALLFGSDTPTIYLLLSFSLFVLAYVGTVPYTYLRAREASGALATLDTIGSFAIFALNIYFVAVLKLSLLGILVSPLLIGIIKLVLLVKWTWHDISLSVDWIILRRVLAFGSPLILSSLTIFTLNFSDRFFLQHLRSLDLVGIYAVGYKFGYMLNFLIIQPFNMMWQARMYAIEKQADCNAVFTQVSVLYSMLLTGAALALSIFGTIAVRAVVDPRYRSSVEIIGVVALGYVCLGIGQFMQSGLYLTSRTGLLGTVSAAAAITNLVLNYVLIGQFGMMGAAWATLVGFLVIAVGSYVYSQKVYPQNYGIGRVLRGIALAALIYLGVRSLKMPAVWMDGLVGTAGVLVYAVSLWAARIFSSDELATLRALAEGAVRRAKGLVRLREITAG